MVRKYVGWGLLSLSASIWHPMVVLAVILPWLSLWRTYNKLNILADGEQSDRLNRELRSLNSKIPGYVLPLDTVNAFVGLDRIYVTRGMLNSFSVDRIRAVIAHELGHFHGRHMYFITILEAMGLVTVILASWVSSGIGVPITIVVGFGVLVILLRWVSRRHEYKADRYAARLVGAQEVFVTFKSLFGERLGREEASILDTHPTMMNRLARLKKM
jgi:STE24 endopeptidase